MIEYISHGYHSASSFCVYMKQYMAVPKDKQYNANILLRCRMLVFYGKRKDESQCSYCAVN